MPLRFEVRDQVGTTLAVAGEAYDDLGWTLPEVAFERAPMLGSIDREGITVFNALQCVRLAEELSQVSSSVLSRQQMTLVSALGDLCSDVGAVPHRLLWVFGD